MSTELTLEEAHRLSVAKWEWLALNGADTDPDRDDLSDVFDEIVDGVRNALPEIRGLKFNCGYCEFFDMDCVKCVLVDFEKSFPGCCDGLFGRWLASPTKANALKVLNYIKEHAPEGVEGEERE